MSAHESEISARKIVDVSGYMMSGKSSASDLLREFSGVYVPDYTHEFDLLRMPDGLCDLRRNIVDNWNPMRADASLRRFEALIEKLARSPKGIRKIFQIGFSYESRYPGINAATKTFLENITDQSWKMKWPYVLMEMSNLEALPVRVISKLKGQFPWPEIEYRMVKSSTFDQHAKQYVSSLLSHDDNTDASTIVTMNALEPFNPTYGLNLLEDGRSIVIDRDVRDIYINSITQDDKYNSDVSTYSKISGSFDIDVFIARQRMLRDHVSKSDDNNVLRLNFEDLCYSYEDSVGKIMSLVGLTSDMHVKKKEFFDPANSIKNTKLWKNASGDTLKHVARIEKELPHLCYDY